MAPSPTRRQFLASGTGLLAALAGCPGSGRREGGSTETVSTPATDRDSTGKTTTGPGTASPTAEGATPSQTRTPVDYPDERIERLHQPERTFAGVWSYENAAHAEAFRDLLGKEAYVLEFDHWYAPDGPPAARLFGQEQGPGAYRGITERGFVPQAVWLGPHAGVNEGAFAAYAGGGDRYGQWHADVAAGVWDEELRRMARRVAEVPEPFFFVPYEEFTGSWRPAFDLFANSPEAFAASWRRTWKIFQQEGATNAAWVIAPAHNMVDYEPDGLLGIERWWPGDDYVDYVGLDLYGASHKPQPARTYISQALELFDSVTDEPKPFLMNEIGVKPSYLDADTDLTPVEYTREAIQYMRDEPRIIGFNWWDFEGQTGVTEGQSWGEPPSELTDLGAALREEIQADAFVEDPDYGYQSVPDVGPLSTPTPTPAEDS